jgi:hypothetical protein
MDHFGLAIKVKKCRTVRAKPFAQKTIQAAERPKQPYSEFAIRF